MTTPTAGYELDCRVHAEVFGHKLLTQEEMRAEAERVWQDQPDSRTFMMGFYVTGAGGYFQTVPRYSTDIASAWKVVEEMKKRKWDFQLSVWEHTDEVSAQFMCAEDGFCELHQTDSDMEDGISHGTIAEADAAPLAICLAALKAVGAKT